MTLHPWWKIFPGRLRQELRALRDIGVRYEVDRQAFTEEHLKLKLEVRVGESTHRLTAEYPDTYPYFRVDVEAPDLSLNVHQNPFTKSLCLLGRRSENWYPSWTLAKLVRDQFPKLLAVASAPDRSAVSDLEERQGEPLTTFYPYTHDSVVLVDGAWRIPTDLPGGWIEVGVQSLRGQAFRGTVINVCDSQRGVVASAPDGLGRLPTKQVTWFRWTRHSDFIVETDPNSLFGVVGDADPRVRPFIWQQLEGRILNLTGILMQEEVLPGSRADAWVFVLREAPVGSKKKMGTPRPAREKTRLVQGQRAGSADMAQRTPETAFLQEKKVSIVGLGCVGSGVALELAKSGCASLLLADWDAVDAGQIVRWPLGLKAAGRQKSEALAGFINVNWPYSTAAPLTFRVGHNPTNDTSIVKLADLVLDCSAEVGVQRYLAGICRKEGKTLIMASTTPGARGGTVTCVRSGPGEPCFHCFELHQDDGFIPDPPQDNNGMFQPVGCADPTFTGASFDTMEISLMAARTAVSELAGGQKGKYPEFPWNVAVLSLRSSGGEALPPSWEVRRCKRHPACGENHGQ
jgi:molybdopterin/thiamine biosynthesis adenylyltransferase